MHHFAAPLHPGQQTTLSLRAGQYKRPKKRKRDDDDSDEAEEAPISLSDDDGSPSATIGSQPPSLFASSVDASQRRVAGLLPEDDTGIPPFPFPHAPARMSKDHFRYTNLQQELANLDPPLFAVNTTSKSDPVGRPSAKPALRQTHLGILTTILHRCLLQGDYHRAGRAWGMVLRTQVAGKWIDVRSHGRWGIGAELLLRREGQKMSQSGSENQDPQEQHDIFSPEGFELARLYYQRLIIQFPHRKHLPDAADELTFYPAMFSLWIYEIVQKGKRARQRLQEEDKDPEGDSSILSEDTGNQEEDIRQEELRRSREISERLDELITSPPFDKHVGLLQIRANIALWQADLIMGTYLASDPEDGWNSETRLEDDRSGMQRIERERESRNVLHDAHAYLVRAQDNGASVSRSIEDIDARLRRLTVRTDY